MPSINQESIKELYENKSFSILKVPVTMSYYLAFWYMDFLSILNLFESENIIVSSIELYDKWNYDFIPPNFWYHWKDANECYSLIKNFLWKLISCENLYYALDISVTDLKTSELKESLNQIAASKTPLVRK